VSIPTRCGRGRLDLNVTERAPPGAPYRHVCARCLEQTSPTSDANRVTLIVDVKLAVQVAQVALYRLHAETKLLGDFST
jgi:hypothetical protein